MPNTSTAKADTVMELLNTVVEGHDAVHAEVVLPLPDVPDVVAVSDCIKRVPSLTKSTWCTVVLSVGAAWNVARPDTVAPSAGETRLAAGAT